jgi:putative spermidine/putrescine transport system substrate-binding protein
MKRLVMCLPLVIITLAIAGCAEPERVLRVALPPGRIADFERVVVPQFEELTGVAIETIGMRSADQVARLRIEREHPSVDVLWIDYGEAQLLAREDLLAKLTEADIPNLVNVRDEARSPLGIAPITFSSALGFLVNTERLEAPPRSWAELWEPRFQNELALFDFGSTLGPAFLVMAARLDGGSETNVEPGFARLSELAPHAVVFQSSGPANNLMVAQGEAGVTFGLASQTLTLKAGGAPVDWLVPTEGAIALPQGFQIAAHTREPDLARQFIDYALSVETQTRLAEELLLVVTNKNVELSPATAALVPLDNIIYMDFVTISAQRGAWTDRFNREILTE